MFLRLFFPATILFLFPVFSSRAAVYTVEPDGGGDFPTIQAAIDASVAGDVIELTDGTFKGDGNRDIDLLGKAIILRSLSGDPAQCIIDAEGGAGAMHRGFHFHGGETPATVIQGITITGGYHDGEGGGIRCVASAPTIEGCVVAGNASGAIGGGLFLDPGSPQTVAGCTVSDNVSQLNGGGIACLGGVAVIDCEILSNESNRAAGGAWCIESSLDGCRVAGNTAGHLGCGGVCADDAVVSGCVITGNVTAAGAGGGVGCSGVTVVEDCTISGNVAAGGGGFRTYGDLTLRRTVLWGNCAEEDGDELLADFPASVSVACCDLDSSGVAGAGDVLYDAHTIFLDPLFCEPGECEDAPTTGGDYTIAEDSPCTAANSPCDRRIGALGTGCVGPPVATIATTWGRIKHLFR